MRTIIKIYCNRCRWVRNYLCQIGTRMHNTVYIYECISCQHSFTTLRPLPEEYSGEKREPVDPNDRFKFEVH